MASPLTLDPEVDDVLRQAASARMESQLIRESARDTRDRSILICARSRMLLEQSTRNGAVSAAGVDD